MRRSVLTLLFIGVVLGVTAVAHLITLPSTMAAPEIPFAIDAAADSCEGATLVPTLPWGDHTASVNNLTESAADPVLGCMWGSPSRPQGYRTAWYRFVAPYSAQVTIDTFFSDYDTVLAVYGGSCGSENLVQLACNDDHQGFSSKVSLTVNRGETYFIEVADWNFDVYGSNLNITILIEPVQSLWDLMGNMTIPRSRHSVVTAGSYLYVMGGETEMGNVPTLTSSLQRLDTATGTWETLDPMPGSGYANTTAAIVNNKIFLPSGFTGNTTAYNGTHYVYDLASGGWDTAPTAPWPNGRPLAWGTAVAGPYTQYVGYYHTGGTPDQPSIEVHSNDVATPSSKVLFFAVQGAGNPAWITTVPDFDVARFAHTAAWVQNRLCIVGGLGINSDGTENILLPDGECYLSGTGWQPTGPLNYPRYNAGSAVGPDGRWYIFGGINGDGDPVELTEYYDVATNSWHTLTINYALGGTPGNPARAWPRGAFVGNDLWVMGGNSDGPVGNVLPMIERISLPVPSLFLPVVFRPGGAVANDTLSTALQLLLNQPQFHTFDSTTDYFDTYFFDIGVTRRVTVHLSDIPTSGDSASNYDLFLYNNNKVLRGQSLNPSNLPETITLTLTPGRYYVMVERVFTSNLNGRDTSPYRIIVEGP